MTSAKAKNINEPTEMQKHFRYALICIIAAIVLSGVFFIIDYADGSTVIVDRYIRPLTRPQDEQQEEEKITSYTWAPEATIGVGLLAIYIACAIILVHYLRLHKANMIPWITAMILCTPILTLIMYLLTWPSERELSARQ